MKKERFATCVEIFNRIRWDGRFDKGDFVIGYQTRSGEIKEKSFLAWEPEGDIPWHRVRYFRQGQRVVWDREARIDRISSAGKDSKTAETSAGSSTPTPTASDPASLADPGLSEDTTASASSQASKDKAGDSGAASSAAKTEKEGRGLLVPTWLYDRSKKAWVESADPFSLSPAAEPRKDHAKDGSRQPPPLSILSLNVLFDRFEPEKIYSEKRQKALFAELSKRDLDLIALQEVTPTFLEALLSEPWLQERYYLSDGPTAKTIEGGGQLLLSRYPFRASLFPFSPRKRMLLVDLQTPLSLRLGILHLTSDLALSAEEKRAKQLSTALELLRSSDHALLLGDFNFRDEACAPLFQEAGWTDLWPALHPSDPGLTYAPSKNALAAILSQSQKDFRYDRIYLRSKASALLPQNLQLFGQEPFEDQCFFSDHFGLLLDLAVSDANLELARPTVQSAFAILLPESVADPVQGIRQDHDPSFRRWMPHINLIYPFVPEAAFAEASKAIQAIADRHDAFSVRLESFEAFHHKASSSIWLQPLSGGRIEAFQAEVEALFPQCSAESHRSDKGFVPHLTVAKFPAKDSRERDRLCRAWAKAWTPIDFQVREIALISRRGDEPFAIRSVVRLRDKDGLTESLSSTLADAAAAKALADTHLRQLQDLLGSDIRLQIFGSHLLDVGLPDSDLDLVALSHRPPTLTLQTIASILQTTEATSISFAEEALNPVLRFSWRGQRIDILAAAIPEGWPLSTAEIPRPEPASLESFSQTALEGIFGAEEIFERLAAIDAVDSFQIAARGLKLWAKKRGISSTAWGFWGGFSWLIALTWAALDLARRKLPSRPSDLLRHCLTSLSSWPWPQPLALHLLDPPQGTLHDPSSIQTEDPPSKSRSVFKSPVSEGRGSRPAWTPILRPLPPHENTARAVLRSTAAILHSEIQRAAALLAHDAEPWTSFFAPYRPLDTPGLLLRFRLSSTDLDLHKALGWLDRKILGFLLALENEIGFSFRPDPRPLSPPDLSPAETSPRSLHFALPLGVSDLSQAKKEAVASAFAGLAASAPEGISLSFEWDLRL